MMITSNRGAVYGLLTANFISGLAQGMSMMSIPMYFARSGDSSFFGLAYALMTCLTLIWAPYAGTLVDKYNRKNIFMGLNIFMGFTLLICAYLACFDLTRSWAALGAFGLTFWNYNLHYPTFYGFLQEVVPKSAYGRIASTIEVQGQLAAALAGAGAGLLLQGGAWGDWVWLPWGLEYIFLFDACTYFISLIIIARLTYQPIQERRIEQGDLLERLASGWAYLRSAPRIFIFGCVSYGVFVTIMVHCLNLSPAYAELHLGRVDSFAISEIFYAIGAIVSGLVIQRMLAGWHTLTSLMYLGLLALLSYVCLALSSSVWLYYILSIFLGLANAGVRILRVSYLMEVVPTAYWGRATSIFSTANTLARVLFLFLFSLPFFHTAGGIVYTYWILAIFLLGVVLILFQLRLGLRLGLTRT